MELVKVVVIVGAQNSLAFRFPREKQFFSLLVLLESGSRTRVSQLTRFPDQPRKTPKIIFNENPEFF
jgi:hypothetical protein